MANAAGLHLDANLSAAGLGNGTLDHFEISAWLADLNGFHEDLFSLSWSTRRDSV
jgi:hypothetical protein